MVYDDKIAALFRSNFGEAYRSARLLAKSYNRTKDLIPLSAESMRSLDDDALDRVDAFRVRFCDLQDALGTKVFRTLLRLEEERYGSQLDVLNMIDKRRIVASFDSWKELRNIRNLFSHDYPEGDDQRAETLNLAHAHAKALIDVLNSVRSYAIDKLNLSMADYSAVEF